MILDELAIIVVNYNNYDLTINLVKNIYAHNVSTNIVLVDNGSSNDSYNILCECFKSESNIYVIETGNNLGYSGGNNFGVKYICEKKEIKYISIMNPDVEILNDNLFTDIIACLEKNSDLAVLTALTIYNGKFNSKNPSCFKKIKDYKLIFQNLKFFNLLINDAYKTYDCDNSLMAYVYKVQGCFFVVKKDIFYDIGMFDDHVFLYFEEEIMAHKLDERGYKSGVLINQLIKHNHKTKDDEIASLETRKFHNKVLLESKKYYMLEIKKTARIIWIISYFLDSFTRLIKDCILNLKLKM